MLARARVASSHGGILFADEAFIELADPSETLIDQHKGSFFCPAFTHQKFCRSRHPVWIWFWDPDLVAKDRNGSATLERKCIRGGICPAGIYPHG